MTLLSALETESTIPVYAIPVCAVTGITFPWLLWWLGSRNSNNRDEQDPTEERAVEKKHGDITKVVFEGVKKFRSRGCRYVGGLLVAFFGLIFFILRSLESFSTQGSPCKSDPSNKCKPALTSAIFTAVSFLLGAFISVLSNFLGMEIAIRANGRTALEDDGRISIYALRSGAVVGFVPAGIGLFGLYLEITLFKLYYGNDWEGLFEAISGYGLGGSSMALFLRASGVIYAKAADVCLDLVTDTRPQILQPDQNPAVITDYVGDIVGDIAGVGPHYFGSYAEPSYAALVVASVSSFGIEHDFTAMYYPLLISSMGILVGTFVCIVTILRGEIKHASKIPQLVISTAVMIAGIIVSLIALPPEFVPQKVVKHWKLSLCVAVGLLAGLIIELVNVYDTRDCDLTFSDDASNVTVDLGSVKIPLFAASSILVSSYFGATYGIAVAALGMLSTISTRLAIDAYGHISNNAKRIAHMARGGDADDNRTADIKEGFFIDSAAVVSIALFGAFVSHSAVSSPADVLAPKVMIGMIMGAFLPSYFSAITMERVGRAGYKMARKVHKKIGDNKLPDYARCFKIATNASFNWIIGGGALVMFAPIIVGTLLGVDTLSGLLAGALGSVVKNSISASKAGGARNQAKAAIRAGALEYALTLNNRSWEKKRLLRLAKEGKTIGRSRKDTSGPPLNILLQLMAVESLVLAPWFACHGDLLSKII